MKRLLVSRTTGLLAVGLFVAVATGLFAQPAGKPSAVDQETPKLVATMISRYHISQKPVDDRISAMLLNRFLKDLDPLKLYFQKDDIDELAKYRDQLDDLLKQGRVDFAFQAFERYLKRLDERLAVAHKLIDVPHDYTIEESMVTDGDQLAWATDAGEANERWRKRVKYDLLALKLDKTADDEARKRLHKRYDTLKRTAHDTEDNEVLEMYLSSVCHCFDPHSSYMSPQTLEDFQIQMRLSLEGIGAALRSEDGMVTVASIVAGGAADKDGRLKVKDKIIGVAQAEENDFVDVIEMKLQRVVRLIRGKKGTVVKLRVQKESGETTVIDLVRQEIELKSSEVKGEIVPAADHIPGAKGRIGFLSIPSFYRDFGGAQQGKEEFKSTARDVAKVLEEFRAQGGVDAIVVDLRMNGGGALSEAIEVSGLFIDKGPVVQIKEQNGRVKMHDDEEPGASYNGPLLVLCNRLSASASEIFAGAIKDYGRGIVVGDKTTHGKGTVQNVMPVSPQMFRVLPGAKDRGALKLTINQFYRVNGDSTQNRGVESDVVLPSILDHMDLGESFLDNALEFDRIQAARHVVYDANSAPLISSLREASHKRVAASTKFQSMEKDVERFNARKNRKIVSLNEEALKKERDEDKAARDVEKEEEQHENKPETEPVFSKTDYNVEVLNIAVDYASALKAAKTASR